MFSNIQEETDNENPADPKHLCFDRNNVTEDAWEDSDDEECDDPKHLIIDREDIPEETWAESGWKDKLGTFFLITFSSLVGFFLAKMTRILRQIKK